VLAGVDGHLVGWVESVDTDAIAGLHEDVEVGVGLIDLDPARMVVCRRRFDGADQCELAGLVVLLSR